MKIITIILALFLSGIPGTSAQDNSDDAVTLEKQLKTDPDNPEILLKLGRIYHGMGAKGDKAAVKKAEGYLEHLIELKPDHAGAHCFYGSVLTMKGRDAWFPLSKLKYVNEGLAEMDKALSLNPKNFYIRIMRASAGLSLPEMFNRLELVIKDYEYLKNMETKNPGTMNSQTYRGVLYNLGQAYGLAGDNAKSRESFNRVIEMAPDSELAKSAREKLAKLDAKEKR